MALQHFLGPFSCVVRLNGQQIVSLSCNKQKRNNLQVVMSVAKKVVRRILHKKPMDSHKHDTVIIHHDNSLMLVSGSLNLSPRALYLSFSVPFRQVHWNEVKGEL